MWGVEFMSVHRTHAGLVGKFQVLIVGSGVCSYEFQDTPHGRRLTHLKDNQWEVLAEDAQAEDFEKLLPTGSSHDWAYRDFRVALAFFGEGFEKGKELGRAGGQQEPDTDG